MHEVINFLHGAVARGADGLSGCYCARGGQVVAWDEWLMVGAPSPFPLGADVNVPAEALDRALSRMREGTPRVELGEGEIIVRSARLRVAVRCMEGEPELPPVLSGVEWRAIPDGFAAALKLASGFTGDRVWTQGVRVWGDRVTAVTSTAAIDVTVPGLGFPEPVLLGDRTVEFVTARGKPNEYALAAGGVLFRWGNGWWARSRLLNYEMPENTVAGLFDRSGAEAPTAIDDDCRASFEDAASQGAGTVRLDRHGWHAGHGPSAADAAWLGASLLPEGHESAWSAKELAAVFACAQSWHPARYPEICAFQGPNIRGIVVGVQR